MVFQDKNGSQHAWYNSTLIGSFPSETFMQWPGTPTVVPWQWWVAMIPVHHGDACHGEFFHGISEH